MAQKNAGCAFVLGAIVLGLPGLCVMGLTLAQLIEWLNRKLGTTTDELGTIALWVAVGIIILGTIWFIADFGRRRDRG